MTEEVIDSALVAELSETDAAKAARQVSGGSYSTISKKTTGSGDSYVCSMVIEFTPK